MMNKYQKVASQLAKKDKEKPIGLSSFNQNKNMYLKIFKEHAWPINSVLNFKSIKKERDIVNKYIEIITEFIDGFITKNSKVELVNVIEFELNDKDSVHSIPEFNNKLDTYFKSINCNYKYTVEDNVLHFSVELNSTD